MRQPKQLEKNDVIGAEFASLGEMADCKNCSNFPLLRIGLGLVLEYHLVALHGEKPK